MRFIGLLCVRNEEDRYLESVLRWHDEFLNDLFVFDDQSSDLTFEIASGWAHTVRRGPNEATFLNHEGDFRQAAWESFEYSMKPVAGDWVFALDADEFFSNDGGGERAKLESLVRRADADQAPSVDLRVDEVFAGGEQPQRRVDGFWSDIHAPRLVRYLRNGRFANRKMGCGSVPTYALLNTFDARTEPCSILHYGYADPIDRAAKHARYSAVVNNGHSSVHIDSILTAPKLERVTTSRFPLL